MPASPTLFALSLSFGDILSVLGIVAAAVVCSSVPLLAGVGRGHAVLGIIAAVIVVGVIGVSITMSYGWLLAWIYGLLSGGGLTVLIQFIPKLDKSLLSQSEIESEMRKIRGY